MTTPLRVCIDARVIGNLTGGVQQFIIGLASGLSKLTDGDEEYLFWVYADADEWIRPYLSGTCRILPGPKMAVKQWLATKLPRTFLMYQRLSSLIQAFKVPV